MIRRTIATSAVLLSLFAPAISMAGGSPIGGFDGVAFKLGTLGFGIEAIKPVSTKLKARLGVNYFNLSRTKNYRSVPYDVDINLKSLSLLGDWYPKGSNFFIAGGFMLNGNKANAKGNKTGRVKIGSNSFSGSAKYDTSVKYNALAPYIGTGFKAKLKGSKALSLVAEAGALFHGNPEVTVDVVVPAASGIVQADVDKEREQIQKDLKFIKVLPVLSVGLVYQF